MINDLLEAAELACRAHFQGADKSKLVFQECMRDLRACVEAEKKRRAQDETTRITKPKDFEHG